MEKHCTRVLFALRASKKYKDGLSPIEVSIAANGERIYFNTGKRVASNDWNKERQMVRGKSEEAHLINDYLTQLRNKIYQKENELLQKGYLITPTLLKEAAIDKVEEVAEKTLGQLMDSFLQEKKPLVGKTISPSTYYCFEHTCRLLREFIQKLYNRQDIFLREVNLGFMQHFHHYLLGEKNMSQNTTTKHLKLLKTLINIAVSEGHLSYNVLNTYKVEREAVEVDFLSDEELRRIINLDTPYERLERAKDMFLFGCFTGLSYIDIKTLTKEHFEKDPEGRIWIKKHRVKTGILSRIPLLPMAKLILDKYKGHDRLLPIQDASDVNKYLKDIAILCNITKRITFHTSRHTFATTVTLSNNISLDVVSKMMGHTNTRMTTHYAKLIDSCIAKQMDTLMSTY